MNDISFPLQINENSSILSLGRIVYDKEAFNTERYIYPDGFKVCVIRPSILEPNVKCKWIAEIIDNGGEKPLFRIWMEDKPESIFEGSTPTAPWSIASKAIVDINEKKNSFRISGIDAFLLSNNIVRFLLQQMDEIEKCHNYKMTPMSCPTMLKDFIIPNEDK